MNIFNINNGWNSKKLQNDNYNNKINKMKFKVQHIMKLLE